MKVFVQDPEIFLTELGVSVTDPIDPGVPARLDADTRSEVNREIYFFATRENKERFDADPARFCGLITDPVNGVRYRPDPATLRLDFMGQPYFFSSDSTLAAFRAEPDSFAVNRGRMVPGTDGG